jgi:hypothetical protein
MHKDEYGIIGQIQPDGSIEGGDSACYHGHYIYLTNDKFPYVKTFEAGFGGYVRHPIPKQTFNGFGAYYGGPWSGCLSRDQKTGVLMALIKQKQYGAMFRMLCNDALKLFCFTNNTLINGRDPKETKFSLTKFFYNPKKENYYKLPDFTFMDIWAMQLRGFGIFSWGFWPLLVLFDTHLLLNVLFNRFFKKEEEIVLNLVGKLLVSREYVPTPISWLAAKAMDKEHTLKMLSQYWSGWRDLPEFVPLYEKKMKEVL